MKIIKKILLLLIIAVQMPVVVFSQSYPVQATTQLVPPYSLYLSDYVAPGSNRILTNLLLRDLNSGEVQTRLRLSIEGTGVSAVTKSSFRPQPIYLQGGLPILLTADDLSPYFDPNNLDFQGITQQQVTAGGALPEGLYSICIEVLDYNLGAQISNKACGMAWLILNDPPIINLPYQGEKLRAQDPQNVIFQWTPRHTGSPNSAFNTEYDFELVELWPDDRDPNSAMQTLPPIYETTTFSTTLVYGLAETPLVPGRKYAFRVRARAMSGIEQLDLFKNNGYSEVFSFTYGDACLPPNYVTAETVSSTRIKVSWEVLPEHTEFEVAYRKANDTADSWETVDTYLDEITVEGLEPETEYEFEVRPLCGTVGSEPSTRATAITNEAPQSDFVCGAEPPEIDLSNREPLPMLNAGESFKAADFTVETTDVQGSNGVYSGTGLVVIPFLKYAKLRVTFTNITINTDYRLIAGTVYSVSSLNSKSMVDGDVVEGWLDEEEEAEDGDSGGTGFDGDVVVIDGTVDSVYVDGDNGDIIVVLDDGSTEVVTPGTDGETGETKDTQITDSNGNTWTVSGETGEVTGGSSGAGSTGTPVIAATSTLQEKLLGEVLDSFIEDIDNWLSIYGKGPLTRAEMRLLEALPSCLTEEEGFLRYVNDFSIPYIKENAQSYFDGFESSNKSALDGLVKGLDGNKPLKGQLTDEEWQESRNIVCGELVANLGASTVALENVEENGIEDISGFIAPTSVGISISGASKVGFSNNGELKRFVVQGTTYVAVMDTYGYLHGYIDKAEYDGQGMAGKPISEELFSKIKDSRFPLQLLGAGATIYARAKELVGYNYYADCSCAYTWEYKPSGNSLYGKADFGTVPTEAQGNKFDCRGSECEGLEGLDDGVGTALYLYVTRTDPTYQGNEKLLELSNYLTSSLKGKSFIFYEPDIEMTFQDGESINNEALGYIYGNGLLDKDKFLGHFLQTYSSDYEVVFSVADLRGDIPDSYNANSRDFTKPEGTLYEYDYSDLVTRHEQKGLKGLFWDEINRLEKEGQATALSQEGGVEQYEAIYQTNSAMFFWMQHYFIEVADPATLAVAGRALSKLFAKASSYEVKKVLAAAKQLQKDNILASAIKELNGALQDLVKEVDGLEDGLALFNKGSNEAVLAARQGDGIVVIAHIPNDGLKPTKVLSEGEEISEAVDGYVLAKADDGTIGFKQVDNALNLSDDLLATFEKLNKDLQNEVIALGDDMTAFLTDLKGNDELINFFNGKVDAINGWKVAKETDLATDVTALEKISNYLKSGADINVFKADMSDVLSTGHQSLKNQWLNTLGDDNYILLRRGTDRYSDISAFDQSGYMLSDAARTKYIESGGDLEEALNYADEVHQQWLDIFDGDIYKYAEEHSLRGNFEMEEVYGLKRTLVSFTSDKSKIDNFIPDGGEVFIGVFEKSKIVKQTLNTSNEGEYLIIGGTEIFNIVL